MGRSWRVESIFRQVWIRDIAFWNVVKFTDGYLDEGADEYIEEGSTGPTRLVRGRMVLALRFRTAERMSNREFFFIVPCDYKEDYAKDEMILFARFVKSGDGDWLVDESEILPVWIPQSKLVDWRQIVDANRRGHATAD